MVGELVTASESIYHVADSIYHNMDYAYNSLILRQLNNRIEIMINTRCRKEKTNALQRLF